jgi:O-antigen/teichoic acid export membrane protein
MIVAGRHAINLLSLVAIQGANAVLPLIVFPFALGVVGAQQYELIVQGEAISLFLLSIVLFSFDVTGVSALAGCNPARDADRIAHEFSLVLYLRLLLFSVAAPIILIVVLFVAPALLTITAAWMLIPLSFAVTPNWLYLALERNLPLAITTVLGRLVALIVVYLSVRGPGDQLSVPLSIGVCYFLSSIAAAVIAMRLFGLRLVKIELIDLFRALASGRDIFLANLGVTLFRDLNVLLMGMLGVSSSSIASYSIAEKIVKALQATVRPFNQFLFPKAMALAKKAGRLSPQLFMSLSRLLMPVVLLLCLIILSIAAAYVLVGRDLPQLLRFENQSRIAFLVAVMSVTTLFGVANSIYGTAGLNALGLSRAFLMVVMTTGITTLAVASILIALMGETGAALGFVFGEIFLFTLIVRRFFRSAVRNP